MYLFIYVIVTQNPPKVNVSVSFEPTTKHSSMTIIFSRCLAFFLLLCSLSVRGLQPHSSILSRLKSVETFARYTALK